MDLDLFSRCVCDVRHAQRGLSLAACGVGVPSTGFGSIFGCCVWFGFGATFTFASASPPAAAVRFAAGCAPLAAGAIKVLGTLGKRCASTSAARTGPAAISSAVGG